MNKERTMATLPGTTEVEDFNPAMAEQNQKENGPFSDESGKGADEE